MTASEYMNDLRKSLQ